MGILAEIVEVVVPQTTSPNPAEIPPIVYGCLLHLLLRGFYFSPTQTEGTGATVGAKYLSAKTRTSTKPSERRRGHRSVRKHDV
jgi:hypothetical protein